MQLLDLIQEGNLGPDACGRQVRPHEGVQVLDVRHVVDPSGDHPLDRRPGTHDPHPGAHGRAHEPRDSGRSARCTRSSSASRRVDEIASVRATSSRIGCASCCGSRMDPLSLDSPVGEEDESNLGDFIEDSTADGPADAATRIMLSEAVGDVLDELSRREQEIVRLRFGLDGGQAKTLEEVGQRVRRHPRADPPDRGEDARQAAPPSAVPASARVSRDRVIAPGAISSMAARRRSRNARSAALAVSASALS